MNTGDVVRFINALVNEGYVQPEIGKTVVDATWKKESDDKRNLKGQPKTTSLVWSAYSEAYTFVYGCRPLDGPKVRSQILSFVKLVPEEDAPAIATFFVMHRKPFYVEHKHPFGMCLNDAQKLYTEFKTGNVTSTRQAQTGERHDSNIRAAQRYFDRKHGGAK